MSHKKGTFECVGRKVWSSSGCCMSDRWRRKNIMLLRMISIRGGRMSRIVMQRILPTYFSSLISTRSITLLLAWIITCCRCWMRLWWWWRRVGRCYWDYSRRWRGRRGWCWRCFGAPLMMMMLLLCSLEAVNSVAHRISTWEPVFCRKFTIKRKNDVRRTSNALVALSSPHLKITLLCAPIKIFK